MAEENGKSVAELTQEFVKATEGVKAIGEEIKGRMAKGEKVTEDMKAQADDLLTKVNGLSEQVKEIEQKQARNAENIKTDTPKSLGDILIESEQFKSFSASPSRSNSFRVKAADYIGSTNAGANGDAGALVQAEVLPGVITPPQMRLTVRDLISSGRTSSNAITYIRETGFVNNAATVAEGDKKPQSTIKFDEVTESVRVIAHFMKASKQILSDAPMLSSTINQRLMYGLKFKEEQQLLFGDGTGQNLKGIVPQASVFADPASMTSYTIIDQLRLAMLQAVLAEYPATGHVLNPIDWAKIELEKDTTGRHIIGLPQGTASPTMWGLPVVQTPAMTAGKFLTGAFKLAAQVFDRWDTTIGLATQDGDNFVENLVTILCEERLALAVYRPEALIYGTLAPKL